MWLCLWSGKNLTKGKICTGHSDSHAGAQVWYSVRHPIEEVQEQEGYSRSPWALSLVKYLQLPRHLLWSLNFCATHESWHIKLLLTKLAANYTKWTQYSTHKVNIKIFLSWGQWIFLVTLGQNLKLWILIWELGSHQQPNGGPRSITCPWPGMHGYWSSAAACCCCVKSTAGQINRKVQQNITIALPCLRIVLNPFSHAVRAILILRGLVTTQNGSSIVRADCEWFRMRESPFEWWQVHVFFVMTKWDKAIILHMVHRHRFSSRGFLPVLAAAKYHQ